MRCLEYDHKPVIVDYISHYALEKPSKPIKIVLTRLLKRSGIRRITISARSAAVESLHSYVRKIVRRALLAMSVQRRKTLKIIDILYALK